MKSQLLLTLVSLFAATVLQAGEVRMNGSTTTFLTVVQKAKDAVAKETGATINAVGSTTGKGFAGLVAGELEVAMSADDLASVVKAANAKGVAAKIEDFEEIYLKDSAVVFVVNHKNTVPMLSEAQVRSILTGEVKTWKEVGGPDMPIALYFEKENSANHTMIKAKILKEAPLSKKANFVDNVRLIVSNVADVESGFGPSPTMYLNENVKVISECKLVQHLCFIIRKDASPEVRKVVEAFKAKM
jgi:phosphate transport system substrate-binding protein